MLSTHRPIVLVFSVVAILGSGWFTATADAQTTGQLAAQAVRQQVLQQKLAQRGINGQRTIIVQPVAPVVYGYNYGYPAYGTPYNAGYAPSYGTPYGYGYGYPNYGYRSYGYNPGIAVYRLRSNRNRRPQPPSPRANTGGSHYFGSPHASQYFGGN